MVFFARHHSGESIAAEIVLDASLPAKRIYRKRGYVDAEYHTIQTDSGDFLCYDVM